MTLSQSRRRRKKAEQGTVRFGESDMPPELSLFAEVEKIPVAFQNTRDLLEQLRLQPSTGGIWFGDQRMVLLHGSSLSEIRRVLVASLGLEEARALLTRLGYLQGLADFETVRRLESRRTALDLFKAGPQLRAIAGFTGDAPEMSLSVDTADGSFRCEASSSLSFESEAQIAQMGVTNTPACWMLHGYASGFSSAFMGRPVMFVEHRCRAMGHGHCESVARLFEDWDPATREREGRYYQVEGFGAQGGEARSKPPSHPSGDEQATLPERAEVAPGVVGMSANFEHVLSMVRRAADIDVTVLFEGESGVGKEVFSRLLHQSGRRASGPFVAVNCAAIPESLMEAELFGVTRGAFTGATHDRPGRFERAEGGTLFLDEVGSLTLQAQAKLLRAIQEREIERVGDTRTRAVDVRLVAATNEDLRAAVAEGRFRKDLFYRLNVLPIRIASLRERRADIPSLIETFRLRFNAQFGRGVRGLTEVAARALFSYEWPGNVRELENIIARAIVLAPDDGLIDLHHLFIAGEDYDAPVMSFDSSGRLAASGSAGPGAEGQTLVRSLAERSLARGDLPSIVAALEQEAIATALEQSGGNRSEAARRLGISRAQLLYAQERRGKGDLPVS